MGAPKLNLPQVAIGRVRTALQRLGNRPTQEALDAFQESAMDLSDHVIEAETKVEEDAA